MADNVAITAGAGTSIATDDVGGVHYQRIKANWGAEGAINDTSVAAPFPTRLIPGTADGLSINHLVAAGTTNATNVKASAGQLYGCEIYNAAATPRFLKFHNNAGTPTAGAGVVLTIGIQAGVTARPSWPHGLAFATGIAFTTVTGIADANADAVTASDLVIDVFYK